MVQDYSENQRSKCISPTKIKKRFAAFLKKHPKISSIFIVLCASFFNNIVTFIINIFLAQKIGPEKFGVFSLAISIMMMISFIADCGLSMTLVRFFNLYQKNKKQQRFLLSSLLIFRIFIIIALFAISLPLGYLLTSILHLEIIYQPLLSLAIVTGGIFTLWVYYQNYLQAYRNYKKLSRYIFVYSFLRILFLVLLFILYFWSFNITNILASLYSVPLGLIVLIGIIPIALKIFSSDSFILKDILDILKKVLQYSKWVAISSISYSLILRATQFILAFRASKYELGILSAGFVFTLAFSTLNMAVRTVFFPHVTSFEKKSEMRAYYFRVKKIAPYYAIFAIIGIVILSIAQIVFLGNEYANALPVFLITGTALSITIFLGLWSMMIHTLMHPEVFAIINILRLVSACIIVYFLSPIMGAIGGAIAYALPLVLGEVFTVIFVKKEINEQS